MLKQERIAFMNFKFINKGFIISSIKPNVDSRTSLFIGGDDKTLSINPQVNTNFLDGGQPSIKAIGVGDLSAGCKFTASTYGMINGMYRDWETDRKSTRLNSSHSAKSRMPSSA